MNRRDFLGILTATPFMADSLFANNLNSKDKDIYLNKKEWSVLLTLKARINRIQKHTGYGNFNILSFDDALFIARNYSSVGNFTKDELDLLDKLFHEDPNKYGFYGQQTCPKITTKISKKDIVKIPHTGHYLYKGKPLKDYKRLLKDVGDDLILTSGVRGVMKQMRLYIHKIYSLKGNITQASHIIAPPAYSYHSIGDFDVGKKGFGYANFTTKFTKTKEFKELEKLNYISMRYTVNNKDGVRYEPWHVKVI
jgi:hypothetical protein